MSKKEFWNPQQLRIVTGGSWIARPDSGAEVTGISTDTRTIEKGQAFLALRGERFDAHAFLQVAVDAGASLLIVDDPRSAERLTAAGEGRIGVLRVRDTLEALVRLATAYRQTLDSTRVIAVTGSNGKTTTVRLIESVLGGRLRGRASVRSYNNIIGVPLTILSARPGDQFLVCEVGMNAPGEIEPLARMLQPDIGVLTSIGRAHIENLGSKEAIAREKATLFAYLRSGGVAIATADAPELGELLKPVANVITFGVSDHADLRLTRVESIEGGRGIRFQINARTEYELPIAGRHNALNAIGAVAVGRRLGLDEDAIGAGLRAVRSADMRLEMVEVRGVRVVNDAYNASPESVRAAIEAFGPMAAGAQRRVMVLGDMLELGEHAERAHLEIADQLLAGALPDVLITVGEHALLIADRVSQKDSSVEVAMYSRLDEGSARSIAGRLRAGDAVLLKGSRRMALERIVEALERSEEDEADQSSSIHRVA